MLGFCIELSTTTIMSLIKELLAEHGSELTGLLQSQAGIDASQAQGAIESIAPMVLNGLKSQQDAGGADAVSGLMSSLGGSESLLSNLGSNLPALLGNGGGNPLASLLGGGSASDTVVSALSQKLGIGGSQASSVVSMLIPVVMGFLAKKGREDSATPDQATGITAILDRDGDGNALDDIAGMLLNSKSGGGGIGGLLGGILGGR